MLALACIFFNGMGFASSSGDVPAEAPIRDGQHDFDFNLGTWKTHISRLLQPLSGSSKWATMDGTVVVRKVWGGKAQIEEIEADGESAHFESLTLFLYNPQSHQWSVNFANSREGVLSQPAIGEFKDGRGQFFDQESYKGRSIFLRVVWSEIANDSHRFEQAFSNDGGKTWETNFVAKLTRAPERVRTSAEAFPPGSGPEHAFDWQLGSWAVHMKRLQRPLSGSGTWEDLDGSVILQSIWNGRANLAEIEAQGATGKLEFLSLRLFNPTARQWSLNFASSNSGTLSIPMVGEFRNGRGDFYDYESINGRMTWVRFSFDAISDESSRDEQAFSLDGGRTWEINWINTSSRSGMNPR